ncbi:hypothetical protein Mapa_002219 [Marchantia paleacea]|nr:hypothetical protein Mapa_002214 [Marchantia paleacea]KAG6556278.1 hypothetical protein Mapa_002219 [Marchantia paleacea]
MLITPGRECVMKNGLALLTLLTLASVCGLVGAGRTYVSNQSSRVIIATIDYSEGNGHSLFQNRVIAPQTSQGDVYSDFVATVDINLSVSDDRSPGVALVIVENDRSVVAYDSKDMMAVEIYLAKFGTLLTTDGDMLVSIQI